CHILFVSSSEEERLSELLKSFENRNVLTVSDIEGFAAKGVVIEFYKKEDFLRLKINLRAAERAGLKISSKLLDIVTIVDTDRIE
ncbi:YfiR family protein, partial [Thermodesulfobacteriota bacterium]